MASTNRHLLSMHSPEWRDSGLRYHRLNWFFRQKFGCRVWKVSLDGGFTCPNVNGTVGSNGCVFCNIPSFSPSRRLGVLSVTGQLHEGIRRLRLRYKADRFVAYFQPATNTYAPVDRLRCLYLEALSHPEVVGLAVGTRPDCVPEEVLDLLAELAQRTWVSVEYGFQTMHDASLAWLNRGCSHAAMVDAAQRTVRRGLGTGAHVILGLPGETRDDVIATAGELNRLGIRAVKLHNLYAVKDTRLAETVLRGEVRFPADRSMSSMPPTSWNRFRLIAS